MSGTTPFTGSPLSAAQAVSYAKGQEVSFAGSKERAEQRREANKFLQQLREAELRQKTSGTQKGTLA